MGPMYERHTHVAYCDCWYINKLTAPSAENCAAKIYFTVGFL
jgi:hypothetical protein